MIVLGTLSSVLSVASATASTQSYWYDDWLNRMIVIILQDTVATVFAVTVTGLIGAAAFREVARLISSGVAYHRKRRALDASIAKELAEVSESAPEREAAHEEEPIVVAALNSFPQWTQDQTNPFRLSAFGPDKAAPGETLLLQAYFHYARDLDTVLRLAQERDADARSRGGTPLAASPVQGDRIRVTLTANGLQVDEPDQTLTWTGEPISADFELKLPEATGERAYTLVLRAEVNGIPVGSLKLRLAVAANRATEGVVARQGFMGASANVEHALAKLRGNFRAYEYVFFSYSSEDRERVLDVAQGFDRLGIRFFQDVLTIRAGENWEKKIEAEIDRADAVMLFWSKAARESKWVTREAEIALARQTASENGEPDILPFILEQPPPLPPPSLAAIHFNDPISCVRAAQLRRSES